MNQALFHQFPDTLRKAFLSKKKQRRQRRLYSDWVRETQKVHAEPRQQVGRILIFPADLGDIAGSLGDDAMISATVTAARRHHAEVQIDVLCYAFAVETVRSQGFTPVPIEAKSKFPSEIAQLFRNTAYDALFLLGADIVDGHYSPETSMRLLITADLAEKSGVPATILGCSFNDKPALVLAEFFRNLDRNVSLNLRDTVSLDRLTSFASVNAHLVADSAFTLMPTQGDAETISWIQRCRNQGHQVIGVNVHHMLFKECDAQEIRQKMLTFAATLQGLSETRPISWLLVPHDYRGVNKDEASLQLVMDALQDTDVSTFLLKGQHKASDLKDIAGHLDGVITGRMHLAVAALGMGVPVVCFTYQGKFEGLFNHFDLPKDLLLDPESFDDQAALSKSLGTFVDTLPALFQQVNARRPQVLKLAEQNFSRLNTVYGS